MSVHNNLYVKTNVLVDENVRVDDIDSRTATTLLIGKATATKVELADTGVVTEVQGNLDVLEGLDVTGNTTTTGYVQFTDVTAPTNPSAGEGRLYKKTGNDGIFWLPDTAGPEVDLTSTVSVNISSITAISNATTSTTSQSYVLLNSMTKTPASGTYHVSFSASGYCEEKKDSYDCELAIFKDGNIIKSTHRLLNQHHGSALHLHSQAIIHVNGTHTITVRYRSQNGSFFIYERSMILLKIA